MEARRGRLTGYQLSPSQDFTNGEHTHCEEPHLLEVVQTQEVIQSAAVEYRRRLSETYALYNRCMFPFGFSIGLPLKTIPHGSTFPVTVRADIPATAASQWCRWSSRWDMARRGAGNGQG